jgi:hypothetical protein
LLAGGCTLGQAAVAGNAGVIVTGTVNLSINGTNTSAYQVGIGFSQNGTPLLGAPTIVYVPANVAYPYAAAVPFTVLLNPWNAGDVFGSTVTFPANPGAGFDSTLMGPNTVTANMSQVQ